MAFYKDIDGGLHFLDSTDFEHLLPVDAIAITYDEAASIQAAYAAASEAAAALLPNPQAFQDSVKATFGGIVAAAALGTLPLYFFAAVSSGQWTDVQELIINAQTTNLITADQYAAIKVAATQYNIAITLP